MFNPGPQAGAPASEGAARVRGEPPSFQCPHCVRVLTTASGRGLHVKKAHPADGTQSLREFWTRELYRSMDGRALRESVRETPSTRAIPARDWLNYISVHINALPSRVRTSRGRRDGVDVTCRGGCLTAETPAHCIQVCHRTHGG
jgi:hypothetical protein